MTNRMAYDELAAGRTNNAIDFLLGRPLGTQGWLER